MGERVLRTSAIEPARKVMQVLEKSSNSINATYSKSSMLSRRVRRPFFRLFSSLPPLQFHGPANGEIKGLRANNITVDGQSIVDAEEIDVGRHAMA